MQELTTGIGVKIQGHLKIVEYSNYQDFETRTVSRTWVDKRNAVNKDNAAIMLGLALTHRQDSTIAYMVFGNGGTTLDDTGTVHFKTPNVNTNNADLYNPVFFEFVDDSDGATAGNQMAVRHITGSLFTDVDIRCLVGVNEPFSQISSNMGVGDPPFSPTYTGINLATNTFAFNEIGLKLADGTLITHVLFSPVLKTASSIIEVVYTLRFAITPPFAVQPTTTFNLVGVEAMAQVGNITFSSPLLAGPLSWRAMQSGNIWNTTIGAVTDPALPFSAQVDTFGNFALNLAALEPSFVLGADSGTILFEADATDVWNAIDAWFGSPIVTRTPDIGVSTRPAQLAVIANGAYILAYVEATSPHDPSGDAFKWFALLDPQSSPGAITVLGAIGYNTFATGFPAFTTLLMSSTGAQTATDPIILISDHGSGGFDGFGVVLLPSPSDMIAKTYGAGWAGVNPYGGFTYGPCEVPYNFWFPISSSDLTIDLYTQNVQGAFVLPNGSGTNLYFYFNKPYMNYNLTGSFPNAEVKNVIQPAFPDGAIIKIELSASQISFGSITRTAVDVNQHDGMFLGSLGGATATYTIDNANWQLSDTSPAIPFPDEDSFISQSGVGTEDTTGGLISHNFSFSANKLTDLGAIFTSRTGTIATVTLNFAASMTGNIQVAIYQSNSHVGVASTTVTNPSSGDVVFTFPTAVPVSDATSYKIFMMSDASPELSGAQIPISTLSTFWPFTNGFPSSLIGFTGNVTSTILPWVLVTYSDTFLTGSGTGYLPMPALAQSNGSSYDVWFVMGDSTNHGWLAVRKFTYSGGVATQAVLDSGPCDFLTTVRGGITGSKEGGSAYLFGVGFEPETGTAEMAFKTSIGTLTTVASKTTQGISLDGSAGITLAGPTGLNNNSGQGTLSFWINIPFEDGCCGCCASPPPPQWIITSGSDDQSPMSILLDLSTSEITTRFQNSDATKTLTFTHNLPGSDLNNGWTHILMSWDTNLNTPTMSVRGDLGSVVTTGGGGPFTLNYADATTWNFFGPAGSNTGFIGDICEVWFAPGVFIDQTWVYQYQNFAGPAFPYQVSNALVEVFYPANVGDHGELPLAAQQPSGQLPFVYLADNPGFTTNLGYGGTTTGGPFSNSSTNPS